MEFFETIDARHSYRGEFESTPVPPEALKKIVQAGVQAPSGHNGQSTSFVILDEPDLLRRVLSCIGKGPHLRSAPSAVVAVTDPRARPGKKLAFGTQDCAAAVQNMLLAITALGYASVWIEGELLHERRAAAISAILGVRATLEVRVILPIGTPVEKKTQREKLPFSERAWFNAYGGN